MPGTTACWRPRAPALNLTLPYPSTTSCRILPAALMAALAKELTDNAACWPLGGCSWTYVDRGGTIGGAVIALGRASQRCGVLRRRDPGLQRHYCGLQAWYGRSSDILSNDIPVSLPCNRDGDGHPSCLLLCDSGYRAA